MTQSRLATFLLTSVVALLVLIVPWYYLSPYLAAPVITAAGEVMQLTFGWVTGYERQGPVGTLVTTLHVFVPQNGRLVLADMAPQVNYRTYGYGLALLWALLLASRPQRLWAKLALGTVILVPSQAISMCFRWLREALLTTGPDVWQQTGLPRWVAEVIAYGYQFGFLMLTPLVPVLLWAVLDRAFVRQVWAEATLAAALHPKTGQPPR
jgi:glucan phosphoethanolaminetransferase (alkaline phosphatase superfamily)